MTQSRKMSLIESATNVVIGMVLAMGTQMIVFPWYGVHVKFYDHFIMTCMFTTVSFVRGYVIRRVFNRSVR